MENALYPVRAVVWGTSTITALVTAVLGLSASAVVRPFSRRTCYDMSSFIAGNLWQFMQWLFETPHRGRITISGDDIPSNESALVISNHLSYSDFYLIHALASRRNMLGRCRYFAKKELAYIPVLGWALTLIDMIMVTRNWMRDQGELQRVFDPIRRLKSPIWLVTYLEGTRYTQQKSLESRKFCESRGKRPLQHVLYPRHKGFYTTVTQFRNTHVKYVYDFTLVYYNIAQKRLQAAPTPVETHSYGDLSKHYKFHIHVRRFAIEDIPEAEDKVTSWLEERWQEKDDVLESMNREWTSAGILGDVKPLSF